MTKKYKDQLKEVLLESAPKKNPRNKKPNLSPILIIAIACLVLIGVQYLFSSPDPVTGPWGKIISPTAGSQTTTQVNVTAETKNLEPGQYAWLVVDKPGIGLCWPKKPIKPNTKFKMIIHEEGKKEPYTLSLYSVHKTINDQWQEWLDAELFGGLPMLPDKRRLDSVGLILE